MTVSKEPNVRCNLMVLNIRLECRAGFHMGHGSDVLRRKVVPMIWGTCANPFRNPFISNPHYVMSSRGVRVGILEINMPCESFVIKFDEIGKLRDDEKVDVLK